MNIKWLAAVVVLLVFIGYTLVLSTVWVNRVNANTGISYPAGITKIPERAEKMR